MNILGYLQRLGKSLMLPIATLPVAALLLRLGQPDVFNIPFMSIAGGAIFDNLPLLFALGIAIGLSRDDAGSAALAGAVGFLVLTKGTETLASYAEVSYALQAHLDKLYSVTINDSGLVAKLQTLTIGKSGAFDGSGQPIPGSVIQAIVHIKPDLSFFGGVIAGVVAGHSYNYFSKVMLPDYLAFFGGKRLVPIMTGLICLGLAYFCGLFWPSVQTGINEFSHFVAQSGGIGEFFYGVLNRALIPLGLHHILHSVFWFGFLGECTKVTYEVTSAAGESAQHFICLDPGVVKELVVGAPVVNQDGAIIASSTITEIASGVTRGDLNRFFAGDPQAGVFMAWAYPIFMFGLPSAAVAMYCAAPKKNRAKVAGLLFSVAFTSFLTGITEPIEFLFLFLAPFLFVIHALLTGLAVVVVNHYHVLHGFGFSAGAIDYVLNWGLATNPARLIPIGFVFGTLYFVIFYVSIRWFNIKTPGREDDEVTSEKSVVNYHQTAVNSDVLLAAIGGVNNIQQIEACITRLRLVVVNAQEVSETLAKRAGAMGVVKLNQHSVQIVVGTNAQAVADDLKRIIASNQS